MLNPRTTVEAMGKLFDDSSKDISVFKCEVNLESATAAFLGHLRESIKI